MTVWPNTSFDVACLARAPNGLALLRTVDAVEPYALTLAVVQDRDGIAVADAHHAAGEVGGEGLTGYESEAKEQGEGGNRLGTAPGMSGPARTGLILPKSRREGESQADQPCRCG